MKNPSLCGRLLRLFEKVRASLADAFVCGRDSPPTVGFGCCAAPWSAMGLFLQKLFYIVLTNMGNRSIIFAEVDAVAIHTTSVQFLVCFSHLTDGNTK